MSSVGQVSPTPRAPVLPGERGIPARPPLRIVPGNRPRLRARRRRARLLMMALGLLIAAGMFATVGAQVVLTQRQLHLDQMSQALSQAQMTNDQLELQVAKLEAPSLIVSEAETKLHMAPPASVVYLSPVALAAPRAAPPNGTRG